MRFRPLGVVFVVLTSACTPAGGVCPYGTTREADGRCVPVDWPSDVPSTTEVGIQTEPENTYDPVEVGLVVEHAWTHERVLRFGDADGDVSIALRVALEGESFATMRGTSRLHRDQVGWQHDLSGDPGGGVWTIYARVVVDGALTLQSQGVTEPLVVPIATASVALPAATGFFTPYLLDAAVHADGVATDPPADVLLAVPAGREGHEVTLRVAWSVLGRLAGSSLTTSSDAPEMFHVTHRENVARAIAAAPDRIAMTSVWSGMLDLALAGTLEASVETPGRPRAVYEWDLADADWVSFEVASVPATYGHVWR